MLNKNIFKIMLDQNKIYIPSDYSNDQDNKALAATMSANLMGFGFKPSPALVERLSKCTKDEIVELYKAFTKELNANRIEDSRAFYPGFPKEVMKLSDVDIFFDQLVYALSGFEVMPEGKNDAPWFGTTIEKGLDISYDEDVHEYINQLIRQTGTYSDKELQHLIKYNETYKIDLPEAKEIPIRENRVVLFIITGEDKDKAADYFDTATDVLRYIAAKSAIKDEEGNINSTALEAASLKNKSFLDYRFTRPERRAIMDLLKVVGAKKSWMEIAEDMWRHKKTWKSVIKGLHPNEFKGNSVEDKKALDNIKEACKSVCDKGPADRFHARLEKALQDGNLTVISDMAKERPGEIASRMEQIMSIEAKEKGAFSLLSSSIDIFESIADKLPSNILIRTYAHFVSPESKGDKTYFHKGKIFVKESTYKPEINDVSKARISNIALNALSNKLRSCPPLGRVYVSPSMGDYMLPKNGEGKALGLAAGSKISPEIEDADIRRLFVWWTDSKTDKYVDLDLSATILDKDYNQIRTIAWNGEYNAYNGGIVYSGDVRDGGDVDGPGVAEYIDIDRNKLPKSAKYISMSVNAYTNETFSTLPNAKAGFMELEEFNTDKHFDYRSVAAAFDLNTPTKTCIPFIYDIENNKMIWADLAYSHRGNINVASHQMSYIGAITKYVTTKEGMSIGELAILNAEARGEVVFTKEEADILFMTNSEKIKYEEEIKNNERMSNRTQTFILPTDSSYILSELLPTKDETKDKEKLNNEMEL